MKFGPGIFFMGVLLVLNVGGCHTNRLEIPEAEEIEVSFAIERWDQQLLQLKEKEQVAQFLQSNPLFSQNFLHIDQYPHDSLAVNYLYSFLNNPASSVLKDELTNVFGDLNELKKELEKAFQYLLYYYPDSKIPKVYTAITGFAGNDLLVTDSVLIIGLDYYLGEGATYRPLEFPRYILKRYRPEYIVPSAILLLSSGRNKTDLEDNSMLAEMVYFGKAYYFAKKILPLTPDSLLIGYTGDDLTNVYQNQDLIWSHFVEEQLLYENSHFIKKKYMDERPKTLEIGNKCPGRIGEWVGWQIVKKYMDQESVSLVQLMEISNAQQLFIQSKYKPQTP